MHKHRHSASLQPDLSRNLSRVAGTVMVSAAIFLFLIEKRKPLRRVSQPPMARTVRNLVMGAMSMGVVSLIQRPLVNLLSSRVARHRIGAAQMLPFPAWARDATAFLLLDYTMYLWHVLTHKVPFLWRFHLVHHIDLDVDTTTALRFHAVDMAISIPWRAAQVVVCGASPRALLLWQSFFFTSVIFHHSNLQLPLWLERKLVLALTTPRLHGIHHSIVRDETDSNWSSGISLWDWIHGTMRLDVPQREIATGVPAYLDPTKIALWPSMKLPFQPQPHAWDTEECRPIIRDRLPRRGHVFPA